MARKVKTQRNRERIQLPNGCSFTEPYISPDNWNTSKASARIKWFIRFTYYDPIHRPNGKAIKWEKTLNNFKTLPERQEEGRRVMETVLRDLKAMVNPVMGNIIMPYNQIAGVDQVMIKHEFLTPTSSLKKVLDWSFTQFPDNKTKSDIKSYLYIIHPGLVMSRLDKFPIRDVTPQHIIMLLGAVSQVTSRWDEKHKKHVPLKWSDYKYNRCLDYLSMMLNKVVELKVIVTNPCHGLSKKTWEKKPNKALIPHELKAIDERLKAKPDYRRFIQIFHSSGSRITEMMKVQAKDVHVDQYCFYRWVLKKKSRKITQVKTTISASVLHLWREQLTLCTSPDDYLFTRGFRPGPKRMGVRPVNIYWSNLVQEPLGVTQGPYILKHMYLTALKKRYGSETAASHAAHNSTEMVDSVYDLDRDDSEHERIKTADISFVPTQRLPSTAKCIPMSFRSF